MKPLERVVAVLGALLLIALAVSVAAHLLRPALPLLLVLFGLINVYRLLWHRRNQW